MGFFEEMLTDGSIRRGETFTCCHCNRVVEFRDNLGMFRPPTMCAREHRPLCRNVVKGGRVVQEGCAEKAERLGRCVNWEKQMEKIEAADSILRAAGIVK